MTRAVIVPLIMILLAACTSTGLTPTQVPLPTADVTELIKATGIPRQTVTTVPAAVGSVATPQPVSPTASKNFSDPNLGVFFTYPLDWDNLPRASDEPAGVTLHGPPMGQGTEPIIFAITIDVEPESEKSVHDIVEQQLAQVPADLRDGIRRRSLSVGGEAAEEVIDLPSQSGAVETFVLHNAQLYLIILQPYDESNDFLVPYLAQVRSVYNNLLSSWKFLK